jgi:hypothetical protein
MGRTKGLAAVWRHSADVAREHASPASSVAKLDKVEVTSVRRSDETKKFLAVVDVERVNRFRESASPLSRNLAVRF